MVSNYRKDSASDSSFQYNAMVDLAQSNGIYSYNWTGPGPSAYNFNDGINAGDLLLAGLAIGNGSTSRTSTVPGGLNPTSMPNSTNQSSPGHKSTVGAVAGGVVGGIIIVALAAILLLLIRRVHRRKSSFNMPAMLNTGANTVDREIRQVEPFRLYEWPSRQAGKNPPGSVPSTTSPGLSSTGTSTSVATSPDVNQVNQPASEGGEGGAATIGSLLMQLSELMHWRNHSRDEDENPPAYSRSNPV
jgi:hypothetical protein